VRGAVLDEATLAVNLLRFREKTFAYERRARMDETDFALFARTETESESRLRPKLVRLRVAVPLEWVRLDEAAETLVIGREGASTPGAPRSRGASAQESAAEPPEFREQGIEWRRRELGALRYLYAPAEFAARVFSDEGRRALGLDAG
jgi:hypothetical protein